MRYAVVWGPEAERMLAAAWLAAPDRNAVTAAAAELDRALAAEPLGVGESRESSVHRVAYRSPLGIEYEVIADDRRVVGAGRVPHPLTPTPARSNAGTPTPGGLAMSVTLPDAATAALLTQTPGPVEVFGPDGTLLGRFTPHLSLKLTDQEVIERMNRPGARWHTPEQVMARLRQIDAGGS